MSNPLAQFRGRSVGAIKAFRRSPVATGPGCAFVAVMDLDTLAVHMAFLRQRCDETFGTLLFGPGKNIAR